MSLDQTAELTHSGINAFARRWTEEWNRKDVAAVLAHFSDDARFTSPKAAAAAGKATVTGKDQLRDYWMTALSRITSIHFALDHAVWDAERRELLIVYTADINGVRNRACELMRFNDAGKVVEGEAMYGAAL